MDGAGQQHYLAGHDRLEALVNQLDADSPLVLDEDANDSLAGEKGHAARGQVRTGISEPLTLPPDIAEYQTLSPPRKVGDETPAPSGELHALPPKDEPPSELPEP